MQPPSTKRPSRRHLAFAAAATVAAAGFLARGTLPISAEPTAIQTSAAALTPFEISADRSPSSTTSEVPAFVVTNVEPGAPATTTTLALSTENNVTGQGYDALDELAWIEAPDVPDEELLQVATVEEAPVVFAARLHLPEDDEPTVEEVAPEENLADDAETETPEPISEPIETPADETPAETAKDDETTEDAGASEVVETPEVVDDSEPDETPADVTPVEPEPVGDTTPADEDPVAPSGLITDVIAMAEAQLGIRYKWGGGSPSEGFDCSGLVAWAWAAGGQTLPHQSGQQKLATTRITRDELRPGDLVFYGSPVTHVGLFAGNNQIIHAPQSGKTVEYKDMDYSRKPQSYGRVG